MNVSISHSTFAKGLSIVGRAVSSRATMPVLSNILLEAKNNQLRLSATNREIAINCWMMADINEDGATTIPARLLTEFINSLPPERITMQLIQHTETLKIKCAGFTSNVKGINAFDFPLIPTYTSDPPVADTPSVTGPMYTVPVDALSRLINSVIYAASTDDNRPTLTGVEVTMDDGLIQMAATDGYRMAENKVTCAGPSEKIVIVVPAKNLAEVARICSGANGDATLVVADGRNQILVSVSNASYRVDVVSELIDARFPDYRATIPKSFGTRCIVDTATLGKALKVALLFARDNSNIVQFAILPSQGSIRLVSTSGESGDSVSDVAAQIEGTGLEISFNARYVADILATVDSAATVFETTVSTRPGLFRPTGEDNQLIAVCMPMHGPK